MEEIKVFVADDVSETGLEPLRSAGFRVEKRTGLKGDALLEAVRDADALVVRSETKVTAEVMDAARRLRAIGRAGVGVDNIDVPAATARGIIVMNAPDGNTMTTAEHAFALLLAMARRIPQAQASLKAGRWERKKFIGTELRGKTLGIIGLGRIGRVVASRAQGFEMKVIAHDPFVSPEQARELDIELLPLEHVFERADFLTIHTPLTPETRGLIGAQAFARMKPGVRIINCERGGLIDEQALYEAIKSGKVAGAALDVFSEEPPPPDHPLLALDEVVATPHLGASTREAQESVAIIVAEQLRDYFLTGSVRGAVNMPTVSAQEVHALQPYLTLAEALGRFEAQLVREPVREVRLEYAGEAAALDVAPITRAFLAGLLRDMSARVNVVNALLIAEERGITVTIAQRHSADDDAPALRAVVATQRSEQQVAGDLFGPRNEGRITEIDGFRIEVVPVGHMLVLRNRDVPGVIGRVGTLLGERRINISRFHLGRRAPGGEAMAVIETDGPVDEETLNALRAAEDVLSVCRIELQG